jgi:NodT family efflux transporter outer membrane factor (OMF) lipoprotein
MPEKAGIRDFLSRACGPLSLLIALTSCAPALPRPDTSVPATAYLPGPITGMVPGALPAQWWQNFSSPALDILVATGLQANPTIGEAEQNLAAAAQNVAAANGAYLPQLGVNPNASRQSYPTGPNGYPPYTIYSITGSISYDPGLFGARHYTFENGQALADYQNAELDAAKQTLIGNIVAAAITEAGAEAQIATTARIIAAEQRLLTLLNGEYADGAIPQLNVLQQQSQILAIQATLPPLQTQADESRDRLAILTGFLPADFAGSRLGLNDLSIPDDIPIAMPSAYLASRPDIRAARAQVAAQNAALGVAVAHLYPDLTLSASGGYAAETLNTLFEPGAAFWTIAANLLQPLYDGGVLHARKQAAQAQLAAALDAYHGAVLNAFGEAADALQAVQNDRQALASAQAAAQTADAAFKLGSQQFALGAADYTTVLNAQGTAAQQALAMVQARTNLLLDIARLESVMAQ